MKFDDANVDTRTQQTKQLLAKLRERLDKALLDPDLNRRRVALECPACFYVETPSLEQENQGRVRARPVLACAHCFKTLADGDERQRLCLVCAAKLVACCKCMSDLDLRLRGKPETHTEESASVSQQMQTLLYEIQQAGGPYVLPSGLREQLGCKQFVSSEDVVRMGIACVRLHVSAAYVRGAQR